MAELVTVSSNKAAGPSAWGWGFLNDFSSLPPPPQWVVLVTDARKSTTPHSKEAFPSREEFAYALANSGEEDTWPLTWHVNKPAHSSHISWNLGTCRYHSWKVHCLVLVPNLSLVCLADVQYRPGWFIAVKAVQLWVSLRGPIKWFQESSHEGLASGHASIRNCCGL